MFLLGGHRPRFTSVLKMNYVQWKQNLSRNMNLGVACWAFTECVTASEGGTKSLKFLAIMSRERPRFLSRASSDHAELFPHSGRLIQTRNFYTTGEPNACVLQLTSLDALCCVTTLVFLNAFFHLLCSFEGFCTETEDSAEDVDVLLTGLS